MSDYSGKAFEYVKTKALRLAGLQTINNEDTETSPSITEEGATALVKGVNDVLKSPEIESSLDKAIGETREILQNFNEKFSTPENKKELKETIKNAAEYTNIVLDAMDEPIDKAIDELNESGTKAASGAASGAIKVVTDGAAAVPFVGAIVEAGKVANDASKAIGDVVEATSEATETISNFVDETSKNIDEGLEKKEEMDKSLNLAKTNVVTQANELVPTPEYKIPNLNERKGLEQAAGALKNLNNQGSEIFKRVDGSIKKFENPVRTVPVIQNGGNRTRRPLLKRKCKTKRVRFSI